MASKPTCNKCDSNNRDMFDTSLLFLFDLRFPKYEKITLRNDKRKD